jgi:steroid 5-alpha reductase family enzyme
MEPLILALVILAGAIAATWVVSIITREYSWTDRLWSIMPVIYVWVWVATTEPSPRLMLIAILVTAWGIRLTFNFARKGGYRPGGEDYRWAYLRTKMPPWAFQVFNLVFIAVYQHVLLLLIALPALDVAARPAGDNVLTAGDVVLAAAFLAALAAETIADQQQWAFQQAKKAQADPRPRFRQTGMFAHSRHPAWFFEITQWWIVFGFALVAAGAGGTADWTWPGTYQYGIGAVLLTAVFTGSIWITERITRERYPEYAQYQARVSPLVPWPARASARASAHPSAPRPRR